MPEISVIIPSTGYLPAVTRLLDSVYRQKISAGAFEVLLILNGVAPEDRTALRGRLGVYPGLRLFFLEEKGASGARNHGLEQATAPVLLFLDDDCELAQPYFLEEHLHFHRKHPAVFAVGGGYQLPLGSGFWDEVYNDLQMRWMHAGRIGEGMSYLLGGNFSVKSGQVQRYGLRFDPFIRYGGSESDLFRRAAGEGLRMEYLDLDVIHHTRESLRSLTRKVFKQGAGKAHTDAKQPLTDGEAGSSAESGAEPVSIVRQLCRLYFNYIFWAGYYRYQRRSWRLLGHLLRDLGGRLQLYRYRALDQVNHSVAEKRKRGERF